MNVIEKIQDQMCENQGIKLLNTLLHLSDDQIIEVLTNNDHLTHNKDMKTAFDLVGFSR